MNDIFGNWSTIHRSALHHAARPMRWVPATPRPHGAVRFRCPVSGSFVLISDDENLARLRRRRARLRCPDCGETHLLVCEDAAPIVAEPAKS